MAQTQDGTLWIGGETGLFQFDGVRFKRFKGSNDDAVSSQYVSTLTASAKGDLWIGFQLGGVARLENGTLVDLRLPDISGVEVMRATRKEFSSARFIVLTTYSGDVQALDALKAGASGPSTRLTTH